LIAPQIYQRKATVKHTLLFWWICRKKGIVVVTEVNGLYVHILKGKKKSCILRLICQLESTCSSRLRQILPQPSPATTLDNKGQAAKAKISIFHDSGTGSLVHAPNLSHE